MAVAEFVAGAARLCGAHSCFGQSHRNRRPSALRRGTFDLGRVSHAGGAGGIRTPDPLLRTEQLYPAELRRRGRPYGPFRRGRRLSWAGAFRCGLGSWRWRWAPADRKSRIRKGARPARGRTCATATRRDGLGLGASRGPRGAGRQGAVRERAAERRARRYRCRPSAGAGCGPSRRFWWKALCWRTPGARTPRASPSAASHRKRRAAREQRRWAALDGCF